MQYAIEFYNRGSGLFFSDHGEQHGAQNVTRFLVDAALVGSPGAAGTLVRSAEQRGGLGEVRDIDWRLVPVRPGDVYEDELNRFYRYGRWSR